MGLTALPRHQDLPDVPTGRNPDTSHPSTTSSGHGASHLPAGVDPASGTSPGNHASTHIPGGGDPLTRYPRFIIPRAGKYLGPPYLANGTSSTVIFAEKSLFCQPFVVLSTTTIDRISTAVTLAGTAGAVIRMGVFADDGFGYPGVLLFDAGTVDGTVVATPSEITVNQVLLPGLYWLGWIIQGAAGTRPTARRTSSGADSLFLGFDAFPGSSPMANSIGWVAVASGIAGALPNPAPAGMATIQFGSDVPVQCVRVA